MLKIIETREAKSSQEIMDIDAALLGSDSPILHLYTWPKPTASYGCLVNPADFLQMDNLGDLTLAKRPTGGGIIFHLTDLAFSFLTPHCLPTTEENYLFVNQIVASCLESPTSLLFQEADNRLSRFCMSKATKYDIILDGGKLVGAAQRRTKKGLLHQGSISLSPPPDLSRLLKPDILADMQTTSRYLFPSGLSPATLASTRFALEQRLITAFSQVFSSQKN